MNASEGGIDALFAGIDSAGAFVRYLLRFVADERRVAPVRDLLGETAAEIAKRPVYAAEWDFCAQAQPQVAALGEAHGTVATAAGGREGIRAEASGFKRALLDSAEVAQNESAAARRRYDSIEAERGDLRYRTDVARRQRDEYRRLTAVFRFQAAELEAEAAEIRAQNARLDADAWAAVPDRAALVEADATLEAHRRTLEIAAQDAAPQVAAVKAAQAELAGALDHHIAEITAQLESLAEADEAATEAKETAEAERRAAVRQQESVDAERGEHTRAIERVEARQRELVERSFVQPGERLTAAAARLEAATDRFRSAIDRIHTATDRATGERREVRSSLPAARTTAEQSTRAHDTLTGQAARLAVAAAELGRVSEVGQVT
ncbi:MAG TPA: hypothetical protein VFB74_21015 [Kribbellaceae bacterium]|nr:hypothetical protein [Kribbellaceae bacterium]